MAVSLATAVGNRTDVHLGLSLSSIVIAQPCISPVACTSPFCAAASSAPALMPMDQVAMCDEGDWTAGAIWRGGERLANLLLRAPGLVRERRVLVLGAGTGLDGLAAALAGASEVVLTDRHVEQLVENVRLNPLLSPRVRVRELHWGDATATRSAAAYTDIVLACDVVYPASEESLGLLLQTLQLIRRPLLLGYVERSAATTERLMAGLSSLGHSRCRRMPLGAKTSLIALDGWSVASDDNDADNEEASRASSSREASACVPVSNISVLRW